LFQAPALLEDARQAMVRIPTLYALIENVPLPDELSGRDDLKLELALIHVSNLEEVAVIGYKIVCMAGCGDCQESIVFRITAEGVLLPGRDYIHVMRKESVLPFPQTVVSDSEYGSHRGDVFASNFGADDKLNVVFDEPQLEALTIETAPSAACAADEVANQDVGIQYDANPLLTFWQDAFSLEYE
jgi:hypothetical protein